jgi:hypothetical protein
MPSTGLSGRETGCLFRVDLVVIGSKSNLSPPFNIPLSLIWKCNTIGSVILMMCRLKCNRSHPCENCIRRGDASSCSYTAPGTRKKNQSQGATSPDDMQNRIDRLEGLVLSLMTNGAQSVGPAAAISAISRTQSDSAGSSSFPLDLDREDDDMIKEEDEDEDSEVEGVTNSLGVLKVDADKGKSLYLGDSHWHLVLADVSCLPICTPRISSLPLRESSIVSQVFCNSPNQVRFEGRGRDRILGTPYSWSQDALFFTPTSHDHWMVKQIGTLTNPSYRSPKSSITSRRIRKN